MPRYFDEVHRPKKPDYFADKGKPKKADWRRHEKEIARRSGERRVAGSGNQPGKPGDVMGDRFLREAKATKHASLAIQAKWLRGIIVQAARMGRIPVVEIRLEAAKAPVPTDWVLLTAQDFADLVGEG